MLELPVPRHLAYFVRRVGVVPAHGASRADTYQRLPDGETELVVRLDEGGATASAIGTRTHALRKSAAPRAGHLLVRFRVGGASPFFGRPACELTDRVVPLTELWRRDALASIQAARDASTAADAVFTALARVLASGEAYAPGTAVVARRAVRAVLAAPRLPEVRSLARALGVSERHLRRAFAEAVGVSPRQFVRGVRLQRALALARATPREPWAAIAARAGYFDQAHLIADFRALTGTTPGALVAPTRA